MSKLKTLLKAFRVGLSIKGPFSMLASLLGFAAAFLPVLIAGRLRLLTDELQKLAGTNQSAAPALTVFFTAVAFYIAQVIITNLGQYSDALDEIKIQRYIKRTILRQKCEVRYQYIENYDDFQKRVAFAEEYAGRTMAKSIASILTILQRTITFVTASLALWKVSPYIVLILFATCVPAAILSYKQQEETFRGRAKWIEEGSMAIHYFCMIGGAGYRINEVQEIRHFALFDYLKARWRAIADDYIGKKNKIMTKHVKYNTVADFLRSAVFLGILLIAAYEIYQNPALGLGLFTLVFTLSGQLQSVTGELLVDIMVLAQNIPYMQEFFYFENLEREPECTKTNETDGNIEFNNVTFQYPNTDTDVLKNISVKIKTGEKIAVVGENGSGKSTFISLLCGMFESASGEISVAGANLKQNPAAARNAVSVVFQDFAHYEATLRDNITVSDKNRSADDGEIIALLQKINVNDVVSKQPSGLDELVGSFSEKANDLSGGQWQKISIARAAYRKDAKIMILDEPTAALDPMAEAQLYRNFAALTGDKTTILISHRLGITAVVDRILVFKDGEIVEDGSHRDLMAQNGHYAQMYKAQAQWYSGQ